ncbi:uncharacterized protein J4E78_002756 [Alternaria triticimaculans]|uniref:uncharacterized protein n=1 Tax=Alternaria triticimaculans TaxID=297637 RepID=UPI0020C570A4|nr:uncharacterized protein J4E78_002756 [Alternaria triticimaculans]KAI4665296.1 hypothetical protein J4E78_002756 [Alternaria triticimaculans]
MDTISRNLVREYRTNITAMVAAVTEEEKNHSIMNLAGYINILTSLGRWDADLSNACLELARLYFGKEDYAQAKQTAHAGLIVEKNFFIATPSKPQLNEIIGQCHEEDERLLEEYNKAAMGPFSILPM